MRKTGSKEARRREKKSRNQRKGSKCGKGDEMKRRGREKNKVKLGCEIRKAGSKAEWMRNKTRRQKMEYAQRR